MPRSVGGDLDKVKRFDVCCAFSCNSNRELLRPLHRGSCFKLIRRSALRTVNALIRHFFLFSGSSRHGNGPGSDHRTQYRIDHATAHRDLADVWVCWLNYCVIRPSYYHIRGTSACNGENHSGHAYIDWDRINLILCG